MLDYIETESDRAFPNETGGILFGYWSSDESGVVILHATGPGPDARHRSFGFTPDAAYHEAEVARLYSLSNRRGTYLGDWHTHPNCTFAALSRRDRRTMRTIARCKEARAPRPLMLLLSGELGNWHPTIWCMRIKRLGRLPLFHDTHCLALTIY